MDAFEKKLVKKVSQLSKKRRSRNSVKVTPENVVLVALAGVLFDKLDELQLSIERSLETLETGLNDVQAGVAACSDWLQPLAK